MRSNSKKNLNLFLENYFKTRSSSPKTKVEAINPAPINSVMILALRQTLRVANSFPSF